MTPRSLQNPADLRGLLWLSQLCAVAIITGLAWFLPDLIAIEPIALPRMPLLILSIVAVLLVFVARHRLLPRSTRADRRHDPLASLAPQPREARLERYLIVLALCEIPAILALVWALTGAPPEYALALGAASFLALWMSRPASLPGSRPG